jgi:peptidoglycan/LPS O-acetylase OafA/YrhL
MTAGPDASATRLDRTHVTPRNTSAKALPELATTLSTRHNALNAVRLILAILVIAGHADELGGFSTDHNHGVLGHGFAVDGFFALSGFLMAQSLSRHPAPARFVWNRLTRLLPSLWFSLIVVAVLIAPIAWLQANGSLSEFWSAPDGPLGFVLRNATMWIRQPGIAGGPTGVAVEATWSGAVWTLGWAFTCDLALLAMATAGLLGNRRRPTAILWIATWLAALASAITGFGADPFAPFSLAAPLRFGLLFLSGTLIFQFRHRIPLKWPLALAASVVVGATMPFMDGNYRLVAALPWAYLLLWLSARLPTRLGSRNDLSYGLFLFGFAAQQILAVFGLPTLGWIPYVAGSVALAIALAAAGWFLVEKPAMRLKASVGPTLVDDFVLSRTSRPIQVASILAAPAFYAALSILPIGPL